MTMEIWAKMIISALLSIVSLQFSLLSAKPTNSSGGHQKAFHPAKPCDPEVCQLPTCLCPDTSVPGGYTTKEIPQIVMFSFDDALRYIDYKNYYSPIFHGRKNPNGCAIGLTHFVSHRYTDYALAEHTYSVDGAEIADHSVTHRTPTTWWSTATEEEWTHEIMDQQSILSLWGNIEKEQVRGFRSPFLVTSETELMVLHKNKFLYEASMVTDTNYWPFTLDYKSPICGLPATCPVNAYPGLWLVPNMAYNQSNGYQCPMLDACTAPTTEDDWISFFDENFKAHYDSNRSPFGVYSHSSWFYGEQSQARVNALKKFLDKVASMSDVYIVTHAQMLEWVRNPTPLDELSDFAPWKCPVRPTPRCDVGSPRCDHTYQTDERLRTCSFPCPHDYPGYGNPEGNTQFL